MRVVVLTGAGMSAESGISTFRDSDGLWESYRVEDVCTPEAWMRNPTLVNDFYNERRKQLVNVHPNKGHKLLAEMEHDFDVNIITQNIDDLHERAGSHHVLHLHGELRKVRSSDNPTKIYTLDGWELKLGTKAEDGSVLRPHVVWFGEAVPNIEPAIKLMEKADAVVVIGTSLNVYPAAGLINYAPKGIPIYLIDPKIPETIKGMTNVITIEKKATDGMRELIPMLRKLKEEKK
ncbi:MAG: SIR2 family NAD-dependent protein deacylase [Marinifilaceae bacterium]